MCALGILTSHYLEKREVTMKKYVIYSHQGGISLNGRQYLLDDNDELLKFDSPTVAIDYLAPRGIKATTVDELETYGIWITEDES